MFGKLVKASGLYPLLIKLSRKAIYATVAQSVEQLIRNQQVAGSNPASSSKKTADLQAVFFTVR